MVFLPSLIKIGKKCGFFIKGQFLNVSGFFTQTLICRAFQFLHKKPVDQIKWLNGYQFWNPTTTVNVVLRYLLNGALIIQELELKH